MHCIRVAATDAVHPAATAMLLLGPGLDGIRIGSTPGTSTAAAASSSSSASPSRPRSASKAAGALSVGPPVTLVKSAGAPDRAKLAYALHASAGTRVFSGLTFVLHGTAIAFLTPAPDSPVRMIIMAAGEFERPPKNWTRGMLSGASMNCCCWCFVHSVSLRFMQASALLSSHWVGVP
jgi:hypothetical protein